MIAKEKNKFFKEWIPWQNILFISEKISYHRWMRIKTLKILFNNLKNKKILLNNKLKKNKIWF